MSITRNLYRNHIMCFKCGWSGDKSEAIEAIALGPAHAPRDHICPNCREIIEGV